MKSIATLSTLALAASAPAKARLARRNNVATVDVPTSSDVQTAITEWALDVQTVNAFLEGAPANLDNLAQLASDAQNAASNFAAEEPNQLGTLINWFTNDPNNDKTATDAFHCATSDLKDGQTIGSTTFNFKSLVLDVFDDIVEDANAGNRDAVSNLLDVVNSYRCCNVLPDLDIIWKDSAESAELAIQTPLTGGAPITAERPSTCANFDCSKTAGASTCASDDNGSF